MALNQHFQAFVQYHQKKKEFMAVYVAVRLYLISARNLNQALAGQAFFNQSPR